MRFVRHERSSRAGGAPLLGGLCAVLALASLACACTPSAFLRKREVTYNFKSEGFLDPHTLQTIGTAGRELSRAGEAAADRDCLNRAGATARARALRVLLHAHFEIPAQPAADLSGGGDFERDYPAVFSERDLLRAELDFAPLLRQGFLALQDSRSREVCSVVFRIEGTDLPARIRAFELSFVPERRPWTLRDNRTQTPGRGAEAERKFP